MFNRCVLVFILSILFGFILVQTIQAMEVAPEKKIRKIRGYIAKSGAQDLYESV